MSPTRSHRLCSLVHGDPRRGWKRIDSLGSKDVKDWKCFLSRALERSLLRQDAAGRLDHRGPL